MKIALSILIVLLASTVTAQQKFEVYFDFNKETVNSVSKQAFSQWISDNSDATVLRLSGYADSVDANSYNKELSSRRIQSVLASLKSAKIKLAENLVLRPVGEDFEIAEDQAQNRKVTIVYLSKSDSTSATQGDSIHDDLPKRFANRRPGDLVRIRNIHFYRNKEEVIPESEPLLEQLYQVMLDNPRLSIEIHGHICCNPNIYDTRLSYRRAKYIFTYLLQKGIALNRLAYMGFGSSEPVYPIPEQSHEEQVANRRVEILIVRN